MLYPSTNMSLNNRLHLLLMLSICVNICSSVPSRSDNTYIMRKVRRVGWYLREYKFFSNDSRPSVIDRGRNFASRFPTPRLDVVDEGLARACGQGFAMCLMFIDTTAKKSRKWQRLVGKLTTMMLGTHKVMADNYVLDPFKTTDELFYYQTSAAYYMCYYTMRQQLELRHFKEDCPVLGAQPYKDVLRHRPAKGINRPDFRTDDKKPFACAMLSFCPDPCCGFIDKGTVEKPNTCWRHKTNPCRSSSLGGCSVKLNEQLSFDDVTDSKLDTVCDCDKGYEWHHAFDMCVDTDECLENIRPCKADEACQNSPGGYMCVCRDGFLYDRAKSACIRDNSVVHYQQPVEHYNNLIDQELEDEETSLVDLTKPKHGLGDSKELQHVLSYGADPGKYLSHLVPGKSAACNVHRKSDHSMLLLLSLLCYYML